MIDEAIILCGGRGNRLRPYTDHLPKPMLMVGGKPILEYVIMNMINHKIKKAHMALGYLGEKIESYFKDGKKWGIEINYSYEETPKNTAGALLSFKKQIKENFYILSGDHITSWNLSKMAKVHEKSQGLATIGLTPKRTVLDYGVAKTNNGYIQQFQEKPMEEHLLNTGIYIANKEIYKYISEGKDLSKDLFPELLEKGVKLTAFVDEEFWMDIGRLSDYERMNELISVVNLERKLSPKNYTNL